MKPSLETQLTEF